MLCSELLWDAEVVARKQVPTIQDAFVCCDAKTLLHIVEQFYAARLPKWGECISPAAPHRAKTNGQCA